MDLTADEINVLLDAISDQDKPWDGYDQDPDVDDPKTTREGWERLLASAQAKLETELERP